MARRDGYVVFVRDAVPGDTVRAVVTKRKKAYAEARTVALIEAGPERIEPVAAHPGAPWQVLPYERQVAIKAEQVQDALRRIGHLEGYELEPLVPGRRALALPQQARVLVRHLARRRAHLRLPRARVVGADRARRGLPAGLRGRQRGAARGAAVVPRARPARLRPPRADGPAAQPRRSRGSPHRRAAGPHRHVGRGAAASDFDGFAEAVGAGSVVWTRALDVGETTAGGISEVLHGTEAIEEELGGLRFRISADAFFQTNTEMAERLYGLAADYAGLQGWERVYDLFCGIGTIGLSLAPRAGEVWGLEIVEEAIADAIANARRNEIDNARFFAGDVRLALRQMVETSGRPDVLVVDPPRSGLSAKIVRRVIEAAPKRIVYVSCNPTTLAPNAAQLVEAGYALRRVRPVDMFPQTPHIECVALLERV